LDKSYEIGLIKLDGLIEINRQININHMNNKFYYWINGVDKNNNSIIEEKVIDIPTGKYEFNELIMTFNRLLKKDKNFFKAYLESGKIIIEITKSTYSIDFSKQNTLANVFGYDIKVLTYGKHISENNYNSKAIDNNSLKRTIAEGGVFIWCNLIDESYVNNRKINSIYKLKLDNDEINKQNLLIGIEPRQIIYHKVTSRPNKIILKLVYINSNLIEFDNMNLFVELNMKELKI
jgi:hypothetical protein